MIEGLIVAQKDGSYIVRVKVRSCQCDTMEKTINCPYSQSGGDECYYGKYEDFPISYDNYEQLGKNKMHQDRDWVKGEYKVEMRYASERCFEPYEIGKEKTFHILDNISHKERLEAERNPPPPEETIQQKLAKLQAKYNSN